MRVTCLGHAALYIETGDQNILIDPVFDSSLAGGALVYDPPRAFELDRLPAISALLLTHGHFDHFHRASLARLPRDVRVIACEDPPLLAELSALGFSDVTSCRPWAAIALGKTRIVPTPSEHDEPEVGMIVSSPGARFWHMADAEVAPEIGRRVRREHGPIDLVSAKYQPVVRASMGHLRARGACFDKQEVVEWLEAACASDAKLVFPYASGLCFGGRHSWFNRYAFPLSPAEATRLIARRLGEGRAATLRPGDVVEIDERGPRVRAQASKFVQATGEVSACWEPLDTATLEGVAELSERSRLADALDVFFQERALPWLARLVDDSWRELREHGVIWQLVVHAGDGERIQRFIDYSSAPLALGKGRHPFANEFTHVSGRTLLEVLDGHAPGLLFWLAGEARSFEKVISVKDGRLFAPRPASPQQQRGDPLTYFLRWFGPHGDGARPNPEPVQSPQAPDDIAVLAREGEGPEVARKKAMLSFLALREAERSGIEISAADVDRISDEFRVRFGLLEPADVAAWLEEVGLDLAGYTRVMQGFAAVRGVLAQYASKIEPLVDGHRRIARARRHDF